VARFVEMKRHIEEAEDRFRSTWAYRFDRDRKWLDEALTGIVQGTRKLLDSTKSYLLGYATTLSSKVQNRLSNEKSRIAVARNLITTAPISLVKRANERLNERVGRFISGYKRQISERQKDLLNLKRRISARSFRAKNPTVSI
jgi:exonuclease VII large subunit